MSSTYRAADLSARPRPKAKSMSDQSQNPRMCLDDLNLGVLRMSASRAFALKYDISQIVNNLLVSIITHHMLRKRILR